MHSHARECFFHNLQEKIHKLHGKGPDGASVAGMLEYRNVRVPNLAHQLQHTDGTGPSSVQGFAIISMVDCGCLAPLMSDLAILNLGLTFSYTTADEEKLTFQTQQTSEQHINGLKYSVVAEIRAGHTPKHLSDAIGKFAAAHNTKILYSDMKLVGCNAVTGKHTFRVSLNRRRTTSSSCGTSSHLPSLLSTCLAPARASSSACCQDHNPSSAQSTLLLCHPATPACSTLLNTSSTGLCSTQPSSQRPSGSLHGFPQPCGQLCPQRGGLTGPTGGTSAAAITDRYVTPTLTAPVRRRHIWLPIFRMITSPI